MTTEATIKAIKELYPQINWDRFEDIDRALNLELWYGPGVVIEYFYGNPPAEELEHYKWEGFYKACKDIDDILSPLPHKMWVDVDFGECIADSDPENDDQNWSVSCKFCGEWLRHEFVKDPDGKGGKFVLIDDSDGDCCSGDDDLENENQPHQSDDDYIWVGGNWEEIDPRQVLMFNETYNQIFQDAKCVIFGFWKGKQVNYHPEYRNEVVLSHLDWNEICADLEELEHLRKEVEQYRDNAREYLSWSLGGGMAEAVLAGVKLRDESLS